MGARLTDRDERLWQKRAEERLAEPLPIGYWIRKFGAAVSVAGRRRRGGDGAESAAASCARLQETG